MSNKRTVRNLSLTPKEISRLSRSDRTDRLICGCFKGYASEDTKGMHYGLCTACYKKQLSCAERKELGLKLD